MVVEEVVVVVVVQEVVAARIGLEEAAEVAVLDEEMEARDQRNDEKAVMSVGERGEAKMGWEV